jgi:APA family basic amino acid/polyamine antiporter
MSTISTDLPRRLGLFDTTTIVVGSMIGSGIFMKAGAIAKLLPSPTLIITMWVVAGALTLFGALAYAELAAMFPRSGGLYVYLSEAFHPFLGFLFGWSTLAVLESGSIAGLAVGIANTIGDAHVLGWSAIAQTGFAALLIVALSSMSVLSVRAGANFQNVFTVAKSLGLVLLILAAFGRAGGSLGNLQTPPGAVASLSLVALLGNFGTAMIKALWAYDGWINATYVVGEVREPQRNLPRALAMGTLFVIVVYGAANAAYHYCLPLARVQGATSAATEVALIVLGGAGALAMAVMIAVSALGTLNSSIMTSPRVYFEMGREGTFFRALSSIHPRFETPHVAIIVQAIWSLVLLCFWKTFDSITDNVIFVYWIFYALGAIGLIVLRVRQPHSERPYQCLGYPVVPVVFIVAAVLLIGNNMVQNPTGSWQSLALLAAGAVAWPLVGRGSAEAVRAVEEPDQNS